MMSKMKSKRYIGADAREVDRDLKAIRQLMNQPIEAEIAKGGLTGPQLSAMQVLVTLGGTSLKNLSKELGLAHSTVSGIVDRLEKRNLVERKTDEADLRLSKIVVTSFVENYLRTTLPSIELSPLEEALKAAKPAERQEITRGVGTLRRLLERAKERRADKAM